MPLPSPQDNDKKKNFVAKCMSDPEMRSEFPNEKQRLAVCYSQRKRAKGNYYGEPDWDDWDAEENYGIIFW
tara:strand:- start:240 stop:452 length:213 start_codon:yes stop_codon:yes gene_type:complete